MSSHRRSYRLLLALLSATVLLAACGGGDDPELEGAGEDTAAESDDGNEAATDADGSTGADGTDTPADDATGEDAAEDDTGDTGDTGEDTADEEEEGEPEVGGGADVPFPTPVPPTGEPAFTSASKLTTVGLDDVFFGDTVRDIRSKVPGDWVGLPAADARPSCFSMQPAGGPEGTVFMILDGRVERIDIASPDITTRSGIGVGSTVADITELFESNIETATVDGGEEIVFIPTDADDRDFRIIWTTDGTTVTAMRAGRIPASSMPRRAHEQSGPQRTRDRSEPTPGNPVTILVDRPIWHFRGERWSHLVSDTSLDELHTFAAALGVPRRAFQGDHYDIPERLLHTAIESGAELVDPRVIVRRLRAAGLRRPPGRPAGTERATRPEGKRPHDSDSVGMGH